MQSPTIQHLIDRLIPVAAQIQIDGMAADWQDIPAFADATADADGDPSRDIVAVAIAPTDHALLIRLQTAGSPSTDALAFLIDVDMWGTSEWDFRLGLTTYGLAFLFPAALAAPEDPIALSGVDIAIGQVVEIRLPYRVLHEAYHRHGLPIPPEGKPHSWVRVSSMSWDATQAQAVDDGPAVASFHLVAAAHRVPSRFPRATPPARLIDFPLADKWYLRQGVFGMFSHSTVWAYDFAVVDASLHGTQGLDDGASLELDGRRPLNADSYSWNQPIFAPTRGRVTEVYDLSVDQLPLASIDHTDPANVICLDLGPPIELCFLHLRQYSSRVRSQETVFLGAVLAAVGNSGRSTAAHLHLHLWHDAQQRTVPLAVSNVRISLNQDADDPWGQTVPVWMPAEGFFVERLDPVPPSRW